MMENFPQPMPRESVYAEYDEEYSCWGVFGEDSGYCYATPASEEDAEAWAAEMNLTFFNLETP